MKKFNVSCSVLANIFSEGIEAENKTGSVSSEERKGFIKGASTKKTLKPSVSNASLIALKPGAPVAPAIKRAGFSATCIDQA